VNDAELSQPTPSKLRPPPPWLASRTAAATRRLRTASHDTATRQPVSRTRPPTARGRACIASTTATAPTGARAPRRLARRGGRGSRLAGRSV